MLSGWTTPPASGNFTFDHGPHVDIAGMDCADCHREPGSDQVMAVVLPAAESCFECHGEGGVAIHEPGFDLEHRTAAVTEALDCAACHLDQFCEQCHDAPSRPGFHQRNFVMRHGAEAHARDTDCASCHSTEVFCRECHAQAGLAPQGGLVNGSYHDREPFWLLSHGQAGRQDLETCASCSPADRLSAVPFRQLGLEGQPPRAGLRSHPGKRAEPADVSAVPLHGPAAVMP